MSNNKLLRFLLVFLEIQTQATRSYAPITDSDNEDGIEEDCSLAEVKESVEHIAAHFGLPFEAKGGSFVIFKDEVEEAVEYA